MNARSAFRRILLPVLAALVAAPCGCSSASNTDSDYIAARRSMVANQLRARNIKDERVLAAFERVERHLFVDKVYRPQAYNDYPLPIAANQTISQPYIVALMTQLLDLHDSDKVLEVGTGSGYQAAILAELVKDVFTIEIIDTLAKGAEKLLGELGYENIVVRSGDGYRGWPEKAPFDGIIVTCAPSEIPQPLIDQLAEGGRMVIPVGTTAQELMLLKKRDSVLTTTAIVPVRFVPMTGESMDQR